MLMEKLEKALEKSRHQRALLAPDLSWRQSPPVAEFNRAACASGDELPVLDEAGMQRNRIVAHHTRSAAADIYRQLRTQVLQIMNKHGLRSLAITSPHYGDGKTTVALNLGISMAQDTKQTVLLVDLDLRKPRLHQYVGANPAAGLTDYLRDDVPLQKCLMRLPFDRVNILPAGKPLDHSSELITSPKMIALAKELKSRYPDRIIIYDMPPVLNQDDPIAFLPHVDAILVVVRDGATPVHDLKHCLGFLSAANVIGTVLNNCP
jgi:Mrp family chromosome partitioning ATPase